MDRLAARHRSEGSDRAHDGWDIRVRAAGIARHARGDLGQSDYLPQDLPQLGGRDRGLIPSGYRDIPKMSRNVSRQSKRFVALHPSKTTDRASIYAAPHVRRFAQWEEGSAGKWCVFRHCEVV